MKKITLIICLVLLCSGVFGQTENFQHMTKWQNVERELHRIAEQFLQDRKKDPELTVKSEINERTGLLYRIAYREGNFYEIAVYLKAPSRPDYNFPYMEALSIQIGATYMFEVMYGSPKVFNLSDDSLEYRWLTKSWYDVAIYAQGPERVEVIGLLFWEDNFY